MEDKNEESLKKLIRTVGLDAPSRRFTDKIMQQIDAEVAESAAIEPALKALLQRHAVETPSLDFTRNVMKQAAAPKTVYAPIVPPTVWYFVAATAIFLIGSVTYFWQAPRPAVAVSSPSMTPGVSELSRALASLPSTYALGLLAICTLLLIDHLLKYKTLRMG